MGGRGSSYNHSSGSEGQPYRGKFVTGSGHAGIDQLARNAGFSKVIVSEEYAKRLDSDKHAPQLLGAMLHNISKIERIFHILQDNKTTLVIAPERRKTAIASMRVDNSRMQINSQMTSKGIISDTRDGIKEKWFSKSGNTSKVNQVIAHVPLHEYGHSVANQFHKRTGKDLTRAVRKELGYNKKLPKVSAYGERSSHEWLAETFAQAFGAGGQQSEATRALKKVLREQGGYNV